MFEGWGEFFLLAGSAAAVLIGLIFVVVTLMQDKPRSTILTGAKIYMGPTVLKVTFVLVLSAAALIPEITAREIAIVCAVVAVWGMARGVQSIVGIRRRDHDVVPHWSDAWCYGVIPTIIFAVLAGVAVAFWYELDWAKYGLAVVMTALLLIGIRNEWDLVTWLAPKSDWPDAGE